MVELAVHTSIPKVDVSTVSGKIEHLLTSQVDQDRTDLAKMLASNSVENLSYRTREALMQAFDPIPITVPIHIVPEYKTITGTKARVQWSLCSDAEPRLRLALSHNMTMALYALRPESDVIEDFMILKSVGRLVGLCTRSMQTTEGSVFVEGVFYAPTDRHIRDDAKKGIDMGFGRALISPGTWAVQRACDGPTYRELTGALKYKRPDRYPTPTMAERYMIRSGVRDDYAS